MSATKRDRVAETMAAVADRICASVLDGSADPGGWLRPWTSAAVDSPPRNPTTGRTYAGQNLWHLIGCQLAHGYTSGQWAGFHQWKNAGAMVRKGERASYAVRATVRPCCDAAETCGGDCGGRKRVTLRALAVFAREQIDIVDGDKFAAKVGPIPDPLPPRFDPAGIVAMLARSGATVGYGGERAYYSPTLDAITMPPPETFAGLAGFASTLAHEHCHWTGHQSRLARTFGLRMGDDAYSREELVAELGAAMYLAAVGVAHSADEQHAAYIASWLRKLPVDERPRAINTAISAATRAAEMLAEMTA